MSDRLEMKGKDLKLAIHYMSDVLQNPTSYVQSDKHASASWICGCHFNTSTGVAFMCQHHYDAMMKRANRAQPLHGENPTSRRV